MCLLTERCQKPRKIQTLNICVCIGIHKSRFGRRGRAELGMATEAKSIVVKSRVRPVEWLKPYTDETIVELGQRGVKSLLAIPISFVSEHIETLVALLTSMIRYGFLVQLQFECFRWIFHHSKYRVLLGHRERKILSSFQVEEHLYKQRVWILGARPEEEETFQFTMVQASLEVLRGFLLGIWRYSITSFII